MNNKIQEVLTVIRNDVDKKNKYEDFMDDRFLFIDNSIINNKPVFWAIYNNHFSANFKQLFYNHVSLYNAVKLLSFPTMEQIRLICELFDTSCSNSDFCKINYITKCYHIGYVIRDIYAVKNYDASKDNNFKYIIPNNIINNYVNNFNINTYDFRYWFKSNYTPIELKLIHGKIILTPLCKYLKLNEDNINIAAAKIIHYMTELMPEPRNIGLIKIETNDDNCKINNLVNACALMLHDEFIEQGVGNLQQLVFDCSMFKDSEDPYLNNHIQGINNKYAILESKDDLLNKSLTDLKDLNDDFTLAEVVPDVDYNVAYNDEAKKIQGGDELSEDELHAKFQNIKSNRPKGIEYTNRPLERFKSTENKKIKEKYDNEKVVFEKLFEPSPEGSGGKGSGDCEQLRRDHDRLRNEYNQLLSRGVQSENGSYVLGNLSNQCARVRYFTLFYPSKLQEFAKTSGKSKEFDEKAKPIIEEFKYFKEHYSLFDVPDWFYNHWLQIKDTFN